MLHSWILVERNLLVLPSYSVVLNIRRKKPVCIPVNFDRDKDTVYATKTKYLFEPHFLICSNFK